MPAHTLTLFGATGLVGRECLRLLLERSEFSRILVAVRRPVDFNLSAAHQTKVEVQPIDFDQMVVQHRQRWLDVLAGRILPPAGLRRS